MYTYIHGRGRPWGGGRGGGAMVGTTIGTAGQTERDRGGRIDREKDR